MRRVVFLIAIVALLVPVGTAFAQPPTFPNEVWGDYDGTLLGEVWTYNYAGFYPGERVDVYLYRPSTLAGWPLSEGPLNGTYFWPGPESEIRRMSYAEDFLYADEFGFYYAQFMFPRDEVWYPCSFPLKWKCNYQVDPTTVEYHSPAAMAYETDGIYTLSWPWAVDPMDTVAPLTAWTVGEFALAAAPSPVYIEPYEVWGMYWKFSDIP